MEKGLSFTNAGPGRIGCRKTHRKSIHAEKAPWERKEGSSSEKFAVPKKRRGCETQRYLGGLGYEGKGPREAARPPKRKAGLRWVVVRQPHVTATPLCFCGPERRGGQQNCPVLKCSSL